MRQGNMANARVNARAARDCLQITTFMKKSDDAMSDFDIDAPRSDIISNSGNDEDADAF